MHLGPDGKLVYAHTPQGDRIPDFSYAGYEGGGVALPDVAVKVAVAPSGGDDTSAIQKAIDKVSSLPLVNGVRGAVELKAGTYHCSGTLTIAASGVVLRGAGDDAVGSVIVMTGTPHLAVHVTGKLKHQETRVNTDIRDAYVPAGATSIQVADPSQLRAGDTVVLVKPVTAAWVHFMGMDTLYRNGKEEHWVNTDSLQVRRHIAAVNGNTITLDVPVMDNYDARFFAGRHAQLRKVQVSGQIAQAGVENLRIVAPQRSIPLGAPEFDGIQMKDAVDSWVRRVAVIDATNGIHINEGTERITVVECDVEQHVPVTTPAKPFNFSADGSQILFDRCTGNGNQTFYFATQARQQGPVVVLHCSFAGNGHIQPHQRWSTGLLIDNCEVPGGGIDLVNRGEMGTGHGWAIGWAVAWNNRAESFAMNTPPGTMIWSIGNQGDELDPKFPAWDGSTRAPLEPATIESPGKPVAPQSLYLEQLKERLGDAAVRAIGY